MKLVIEITDGMYQAVKGGMWCGSETWYNALKNGKPLKIGQKVFTPEDVWSVMVERGQRDSRFKLGEIIKYSPAEVMEMLKAADEKASDNRNPGWEIAHGMIEDRFWCSCGFIKIMDRSMTDWKYCPKCGATKAEQEEVTG